MTKYLTLLGIAALCAIALSAVVGVRLTHAAAGNIYNLGTLGGTSSGGADINDAGQAVGSAKDAMGHLHAFLWDSSRGMTDLGTGYTGAGATAINASGSVVGGKDENGTGVSHAFAWTPNEPNSATGTMTSLARGIYSTAADINAAGQVVGSNTHHVPEGDCTPDAPNYPNCDVPAYDETRAVVWANGVGTDLTSLLIQNPGVTLIAANAINNAGQVAAQSYPDYYSQAVRAFRYEHGVMYDLGNLGGTSSVGNAINEAGHVVGESSMAGDTSYHAFRYIGTPGAGGVMADLGTLGGAISTALDINDAGFVVGEADRAAGVGGGSWATLWLNDTGNTAVDLDAWLDAVNPNLGAYWDLFVARAINNNGLITGRGNYDDGPGGLSDGTRAFVLDVSSLLSAIPGDYNQNGTVDAADFTVWRDHLGQMFSLSNENPAAMTPGLVDAEDYAFWKSNFGQALGSGSGATATANVPEPTTLVLLILAAASWCVRRSLAD